MLLWSTSFKKSAADSLIGRRVSKAIGWNMYDPDNAAYLACFMDAAISAKEAEMYKSAILLF